MQQHITRCGRCPAVAIFALLAIICATPLRSQNLLVDGDFGPTSPLSINYGSTIQSDAGEGWHVPTTRRWSLNSANGTAYVSTASGAGGLTQVILNNSASKGYHELKVRVANTEGGGTSNEFRVQIYGINGDFSMSNWNSGLPTGTATALFDSGNLAGVTYPTTEFLGYPTLGNGYQYLAIRVWTANVDPAVGDATVVDSISLVPTSADPQVVELATLDDDTGEAWREPGVFVLRRNSSIGDLTVNFVLGGTATLNTDYTVAKGRVFNTAGAEVQTSANWLQLSSNRVVFPNGVNEMLVQVTGKAESPNVNEGGTPETCTLALATGTGYEIDPAKNAGEIKIWDASVPSREEAVRFLVQAGFGPGESYYNGTLRNDIELVQELGFEGWINWQFSQPHRKLTPLYNSLVGLGYAAGQKTRQPAHWHAMLGYAVPSSSNRPLAGYDPLRQKMVYALSQIFVVSEKLSTIATNTPGACHYWDEALGANAFGNYRSALIDVSWHPIMGIYLSHLRNRQATFDPTTGARLTSPDENYAREILQLFAIGTLELQNNGNLLTTPVDDGQGGTVNVPMASYDNDDIMEFARVFTGQTFSNAGNFNATSGDYASYMKAIDFETLSGTLRYYHDTGAKTLLSRSPINKTLASSVSLAVQGGRAKGQSSATNADLEAAIDNIFNHPNVPPFVSRLLIQRFTNSNPRSTYIAAVANAFKNTGGVRGDMKGVIKAMLLHEDARSFTWANEPTYGALREPWMRLTHLMRTFKVLPNTNGVVTGYNVDNRISQRPLNAPSVFNFYLPDFTPPDPDAINAGLVGPEFQISSGGKLTSQLVMLVSCWEKGINGFSTGEKLDLTSLIALADDPDRLVRELDLQLCNGRLHDLERKIIIDATRKINPTVLTGLTIDNQRKYRAQTAAALIVLTPSFSILR